MRPNILVATLRREAGIVGKARRSRVQERGLVQTRNPRSAKTGCCGTATTLTRGSSRKNRVAKDLGRAIDDSAVGIAVNDGERKTAAPEDLASKFPAVNRTAGEFVAHVEGRMEDEVSVEGVANVVIRAAVVAGFETSRAELTADERVTISEDAAVGELI